MASAGHLNKKPVFNSGIVAGIIVFVITGIVNGGILKSELESWMHESGGLLHPLSPPVSMFLWAVMCLIYGFVGVWIYASIRPRCGPGPKTAVFAGLVLWIASKLTMALDLIALGIMPTEIIVGQMVGGFVAIVLGVLAGAWLYKE